MRWSRQGLARSEEFDRQVIGVEVDQLDLSGVVIVVEGEQEILKS